MANALEAALELSRQDGTLWELTHVVELVGPKGYEHGWHFVGKPGAILTGSTHAIGNLHGQKHGLQVGDIVRWVEPHGGRPGESPHRTGHIAGIKAKGSRLHVVDHGHPASSAAAHSEIYPGSITHVSAGPGNAPLSPTKIAQQKRSVHPSGTKYVYSRTPAISVRKGSGVAARSGKNFSSNGHGKVVELVGPKGYIHGWIKVSGPQGHKAKVGQHVRVSRMAGPAYGQVVSRGTGGKIDIRTRKGERLGSHEGMVTHVYGGEGAPKGGIKAGKLAPGDSVSGGERAPTGKPSDLAPKLVTPPKSSRGHTPGSYYPSGSGHIGVSRDGGIEHFGGKNSESRAKKYAASTMESRHPATGGQHNHAHEDNAAPSNEFAGDRTALEGHLVGVHKNDTVANGPQLTMSQLRQQHDQHHGIAPPAKSKSGKLSPEDAAATVRSYLAGNIGPRDEYGRPSTNPAAFKRLQAQAAKAETPSPSEVARQLRPGAGVAAKRMASPEGKRATAKVAPAIHTHAAAKEPPGSGPAHSELLKARTAARKAHPQGHPERLKAERAVRQSRKTRRAGAGGGGGTTRAAGAPSTSRRRRTPVTATTSTSAPTTGKSVLQRQSEVTRMSPERQRTYAQAKRAGVGHERAMTTAKGRPKPPKGTAGAARRKASGEGKAPPRLAAPVGVKPSAGQADTIEALAKGLIARGWSPAQARKLARGRVLRGEKIPQFAPGKKGPRQR
jgi:hypothetical protein